MAINSEIYRQPARKGDVGGIAINTVVALNAVADALEAIRTGGKPTERQIEDIRKSITVLGDRFNKLSGWTDDE